MRNDRIHTMKSRNLLLVLLLVTCHLSLVTSADAYVAKDSATIDSLVTAGYGALTAQRCNEIGKTVKNCPAAKYNEVYSALQTSSVADERNFAATLFNGTGPAPTATPIVVTSILQLRRGNFSELQTVTPAPGEPCWTNDSHQFFIGDGSTAGGLQMAPPPFRQTASGPVPFTVTTGVTLVSHTGSYVSSPGLAVTFPPASAYKNGTGFWLVDEGGTNGQISGRVFNPVAAGSDTINGQASISLPGIGYGSWFFSSNGTNKWTTNIGGGGGAGLPDTSSNGLVARTAAATTSAVTLTLAAPKSLWLTATAWLEIQR